MVRTLLRQAQMYNTGISDPDYYDNLANQLVAANGPEIDSGVSLIAGESVTFSATGSVVTLASSNPQTSGVVPGDEITISGSTGDDGTYKIIDVSSGAITVDHTFASADGGSATAGFNSVRNLVTDLNFLRAQLRRIIGEDDWFNAPTAANNPILADKKVLYSTLNTTDIAIPTAGNADISSLGLSGFADESGLAEGILASTSTPTAGGGYKSEGNHWVEVYDAATGAPITINGNKVYGYLVVDNIATPTAEDVYFVYFNNSTDLEVLVTNLSTQQDGSATNFEIAYNTRSNLADVPEEFGLQPTFIEAAIDQFTTLQQAYNAGNNITLADAEGDLVITIDDAGAQADFALTDGGGDYLRTDAANNTLDLGSAANKVDVNGALAVTGANTFDVGIGQSTFAGNVDADAGLDVIGITNLGDGGTANYAQFSATGDLDFAGTADTISKSDATLNVQTTAQDLQLSTVTSGDININAAGDIDIDGAGGVEIDAGAGQGFSIDGQAASNVSADSGNLTLSTTTSGDVILDAVDDLTFGDQHWAGGGGSPDPLPFSDSGNTNFTGAAAGAISLIDAINQVAAGTGESMDQGDSVPGAVARNTDITIPGGLSYTVAADFVSDFIIFVNGQKMRNGLNAGANFDVYPGSTTTTMRFEFKIKAGDTISAIKIA